CSAAAARTSAPGTAARAASTNGGVVDLFEEWGVRQAALFTFPQSLKHIGLYQKFGSGFGTPASARDALLDECRDVTGSIFEGLAVPHEVGSPGGPPPAPSARRPTSPSLPAGRARPADLTPSPTR